MARFAEIYHGLPIDVPTATVMSSGGMPAASRLASSRGHSCRRNPELAEASCHSSRLSWHPVERIEAPDFANDPAVRW